MQIVQEDDGLRIASSGTGHFPLLFFLQSLTPNLIEDFDDAKEIPYDYCCPSVKKDIQKMFYKNCNTFFAFLTYLKEYQKFCTLVTSVPKVRPIRIAAKR